MRSPAASQKVVLITGASSGFGLLTSVEVAKRGHAVYATMRDESKTEELARACRANGVVLQMRHLDVTDEASIDGLVTEVVTKHGRVDALVNNAGSATIGFAEELADNEMHELIETNLLGAVRCTRAVASTMKANRSGTIVNVSSIAGRSAVPYLSAYSASKFALEGWSECLRYELATTGVKVCLIEPGTFRTPMYSRRRIADHSPESPTDRRGDVDRIAAMFSDHAQRHGGDPTRVARRIADVVDHWSRFRVVVGRDARLELFAKRLLPDEAFGRLMERFVWRDWVDRAAGASRGASDS
jgi:short-subunit dehydrogenase